MSDIDIEQLATFMGHTVGIHRGSYRLPDNVYQTAKISKLLLLMEKGATADYKGKSIEEIDIDLEQNLLDTCDKPDDEIEINEAIEPEPNDKGGRTDGTLKTDSNNEKKKM
nr:unnamed protein product [Callosobruchus analis]